MRYNLISNISNGVGLQADYELLRAELVRIGHSVHGVQFDADDSAPPADVNVFLEIIAPRFLACAPRQWVVPNPEWWFSGWDIHLTQFELVLAKTEATYAIFAAKVNGYTTFTGWRSRDLLDSSVPRERKFLHIAGKSQTKNTAAVLAAWKQKPVGELTVVSEHFRDSLPGVTFIQRAGTNLLRELMNSHMFHLMPSAYEGWGHALHEARSVGAVLITTDAPPMNTLGAPILIPPIAGERFNAVDLLAVEPHAVVAACERALAMTPKQIIEASQQARAAFDCETRSFSLCIEALCGV